MLSSIIRPLASAACGWFKSPRTPLQMGSIGLTELQNQTTKKLAELKAYLEQQLSEHEDKMKTVRSFLETVDSLLAEKSYRKLEIPKSMVEAATRTPAGLQGQVITTMSGVVLAEVFVEAGNLRVVPSKTLRLDSNAPPLT